MIFIDKENMEGIPDECFTDRQKMQALLNNASLHHSKLPNNQFKLKANLELKGGGNIGEGIQTLASKRPHWLFKGERYFVIPYVLGLSEEYQAEQNPETTSRILYRRGKISQKAFFQFKETYIMKVKF